MKRDFGEIEGRGVEEVVLRSVSGAEASIITYGAIVRDLRIPAAHDLQRVVAGLTSLRADWTEMGRNAVRMLLREMKGGERRPPEHVLFPYVLKRGRTAGAPPG